MKGAFSDKETRDDLIERAKKARDILGPDWRAKVLEAEPSFDTYKGAIHINALQSAMGPNGNTTRISMTRVLPLVKALEAAAGIEYEPIII